MKKLFFFLFLIAAGIVNAQEVNWMSMNEALEAQKKDPKKILVDAYTNWCGPCKMLEKNTFQNKQVAEYINENYYAVKFNAEGNETINYKDQVFKNQNYDPARENTRNGVHDFARAMGVTAYPTIVFFDEEGNFISPIKGYMSPGQIEIFLKVFAKDDYKKMTSDEEWKKYQKDFEGTFAG